MALDVISNTNLVSHEMHSRIERFYYAEAALLQKRLYREWFEKVIAEDIHLWMPIWEERFVRDRRSEPTPDDAAIYNDRYEDLKMRVERLYTGMVWMEDPPSRIRYFITNVEAVQVGGEEFETACNVFVVRNRRQLQITQHSLGREDLLRRDGDSFRVARRKLLVDARVTQDKNLYFFV